MIEPRADHPVDACVTLGADKAYATEDFVNELRSMNATPHVAQNTNGQGRRRSTAARRDNAWLWGEPTHPPVSGSRKAFGWIKKVGGQNELLSRPWARRMGLHLRSRRLQSGSAAEASEASA